MRWTAPVVFAFGVLLGMLLGGCRSPLPGGVTGLHTRPIGRIETRINQLVNDERTRLGLERMRVSQDLVDLARAHSLEMAKKERFSHRALDGMLVTQRAARAGIDWVEIGENLARNRGFEDPAAEALEGWMESDSHRANMLSPRFDECGAGVYRSKNGTVYITHIYLERMPDN